MPILRTDVRRRLASRAGIDEKHMHRKMAGKNKRIKEAASKAVQIDQKRRLTPKRQATEAITRTFLGKEMYRISPRTMIRDTIYDLLRAHKFSDATLFWLFPQKESFYGFSEKGLKGPGAYYRPKVRLDDSFRQFIWMIKSQGQLLFGKKISSCVIFGMEYDEQTKDCYVSLPRQDRIYHNVPKALFDLWKKGSSTCITSDPSKKRWWWIGKSPSLGAFYTKHIKGKYISDRV